MLAAAVAKLRSVAPYLIMALVVPGGLLMAPLLWLYRRQKQTKIFRTTRAMESAPHTPHSSGGFPAEFGSRKLPCQFVHFFERRDDALERQRGPAAQLLAARTFPGREAPVYFRR